MCSIPFLSIESCIFILAIVLLLRYYIHRKWQFLEKLNIPHDPPSIRKFGNMSFDLKVVFTKANEQKKKHGPIWGSYMGLAPGITIHDLDIMRQIYTKEFSIFTERQRVLTRMMGKDMNHGINIVKGNKWKRLRNTLSPTFSSSKLKQMFTIMQTCTDQTSSVLQKKCETTGGSFTARAVFSNLSLDTILSTAVGIDCQVQSLTEDETKLAKQVKNVFKFGLTSPVAFICFIFPQMEWLFEKLNLSIFPLDSVEYFKKYLMAAINQRENEGERRQDLLQLLLDAELPKNEINESSLKGINRDELVGNALLMVGAGYENTANTMTFLAYNFAFHPDAQRACQKEIDEAFQQRGEFDYETVKNLKHLEMCLNESLRLYCPIIMNARFGTKEVVINGFTIPKDIMIQIPTFGLCHDPEYWDDPWEFKPERMEDMSKIDPMVFQPFGHGPRNCIGLRFAMMEIKLAFCKILHKFSFEPLQDTPKPPLELKFAISIKPAVEFGLRVIERK